MLQEHALQERQPSRHPGENQRVMQPEPGDARHRRDLADHDQGVDEKAHRGHTPRVADRSDPPAHVAERPRHAVNAPALTH